MYNIAICDDDKNFISFVKKIIVEAGLNEKEVKFCEYYSGEEFLLDMEDGIELDMLILDIQMKGIDGNRVAVEFRKRYSNTTLIFCSGIYKPSPETIKVSPFRFLLKEYSNERMVDEFKEIVDYIKSKKRNPVICGYDGYDHFQVISDDIMYISIAKRGSCIHTCLENLNHEARLISCKKKVEDLYEILREHDFVYAHNSYIVNLKYIKSRMKDEIRLMNGEILSVSRARTRELREKMVLYLEKKYE